METIQNVQKAVVKVPLYDLNPKADLDLNNIFMKALSREPDTRYASSGSFAEDLERYLRNKYPQFAVSELAAFVSTVLADRKRSLESDVNALVQTPQFQMKAMSEGESTQARETLRRELLWRTQSERWPTTRQAGPIRYNPTQPSPPVAAPQRNQPAPRNPLRMRRSARDIKHSSTNATLQLNVVNCAI